MSRHKLAESGSTGVSQVGCTETFNSEHKELATALDNLHIINSLKRPKLMKRESRITNNGKHKFQASNTTIGHSQILLMILASVFTLIITTPSATHCDTICPKDLSHMYPCTCQNGTQGLLIKCQRVNLAVLSKSLLQVNELVEQVEIENSSISRVFGALFSDSASYSFHSTLRELDIRDSGVSSIDPMAFSSELLTNIQYLMLDRNRLRHVPTSELLNNMTNLKLLNLSSNSIGAIENGAFMKLTNLTDLDLSNNKISRLAKNSFQALNSLEWLSLNGNELVGKLEKNIFNQVRKLRHLDLSNNKLTSLDRQDFSELTALETLKLAYNQMTTMPRSIFSRNAKLFHLDLSFNKLDDIDTYLFKSTRFLKDLNVAGNQIKEITKNTFSPTTRIKRINMSQNSLQALAPETFKNLEWLEHVDLSHNQIVNISNDAFSKIYQVEIDLSHNKLTRIFYWAFREVSNMTKLDLSHNLLDDGVSLLAFDSTDCTQLDLSYNQLQDLSKFPISNLTGLRELNLSFNQITELNKKSFSEKRPMYELHTIDLSHNNISQITGNILERLRSIRYLNISHNSLRRLTSGAFGNSPTLLELDLSHNNLVEIVSGTLVNLISMRDLNLTFNRLKKMIPIPVALNSIHLEHNEIGQLSKAAFPQLNSLLELHLDHNRITNIEEGTFATLLALHTLSMGHNNLSAIPAQALKDLASLQNLRFTGNNIQRLQRRAFGTLPIVFNLWLDHNNITSVADHAFDGMLQLLSLNLSFNNLLELPPEAFSGLVSLRQLDLSNNQLNRFENKTRSAMEDLLSLEVANLSNNKLSLVTPKTFLNSPYIPYRLTRLDLSNNLIGILVNHFSVGLKRVEWLSLRNNIINEIQPTVLDSMSHLKHLDLSHNKLRMIKEGTFRGDLNELTSLLLNNNKLTTIQQPRELDRLRNLGQLDLSNNRLEIIFTELYRWLRRGIVVDLTNNNLECNCRQLPIVAWVDNFRSRNHSYSMIMSEQNHQQRYDRLTRNSLTPKLLPQYIQATQAIANLNCARPDSISGRSIMLMLELVGGANTAAAQQPLPSGPINDLNCDKDDLDEADLLKRLKAPIQYQGAEPYLADGEQHLKIGWSLLDTQLDLTHFVLLEAKFQQSFDLSPYRTANNQQYTTHSSVRQKIVSLAQQQQQQQLEQPYSFQLIGHKIERVPYNERTLILRDLNPRQFYVVCLTYETGALANSTSPEQHQQPSSLIEQLNRNSSTGQQQLATMAAILADYGRINCVSLSSLLHNDVSERLISGSSSNFKLGADASLELTAKCLMIAVVQKILYVILQLGPIRVHHRTIG